MRFDFELNAETLADVGNDLRDNAAKFRPFLGVVRVLGDSI